MALFEGGRIIPGRFDPILYKIRGDILSQAFMALFEVGRNILGKFGLGNLKLDGGHFILGIYDPLIGGKRYPRQF